MFLILAITQNIVFKFTSALNKFGSMKEGRVREVEKERWGRRKYVKGGIGKGKTTRYE